MDSQIPSAGYPSNFCDQLLAELIETGSKAIKFASDPIGLVGHPFAMLIQIQIKANCEAKKPHSKLVYLAS